MTYHIVSRIAPKTILIHTFATFGGERTPYAIVFYGESLPFYAIYEGGKGNRLSSENVILLLYIYS